MANTLMFVEEAVEDFQRENGRLPQSEDDWADVKGRAEQMYFLRQAALKLHPTKVAGWKFGRDDIEWQDA